MKSPILSTLLVTAWIGLLCGAAAWQSSRYHALNSELISVIEKQKKLIDIQRQTIEFQDQNIDAQKRIIAEEEDNVGVCVSMLPIEQRRSFQGGN